MTGGEDRFADLPGAIRLCYRTHGDASGEPLVLIAGLGQQLISWPEPLVERLVAGGYHVLRFDNRDAGRSSRIRIRPPGPVRQLTRRVRSDQYTLHDMADDTVALMDQAGFSNAHVVGMSMGGMIAQTIAAHHPEHVRTLTSIFSTTGDRRAGKIALTTMLLMGRPPATTREQAAERGVQMMRHIGSRQFAASAQDIRLAARANWDRGDGANAGAAVARQIGAIYASGDRTAELRRITVPTLVIHGDRDPMVNPSGGRATAAAIPGARFVEIPGMGHDLGAWPQLLGLVQGHVDGSRALSAI
jgi:pimeloyl-ACP methyl ester carboxylesterase